MLVALGYILNGLAVVLAQVLNILNFVIIGRVIISWVNADPYNPIVRFLVGMTEPLLKPIRRYMPQFGGIDLSAIVLFLIITFISASLVPMLTHFAGKIVQMG